MEPEGSRTSTSLTQQKSSHHTHTERDARERQAWVCACLPGDFCKIGQRTLHVWEGNPMLPGLKQTMELLLIRLHEMVSGLYHSLGVEDFLFEEP